ncbi:heterokaryon incompatibility protein-domain-containing protein [Rhexocercosporidium sp. MPI-PUGE-AT-0058]|nr:heterokaryon incompatibility protein-domain-containing protein [Rhexocercosporidium sp. MPI-PUGE-AT-0058]
MRTQTIANIEDEIYHNSSSTRDGNFSEDSVWAKDPVALSKMLEHLKQQSLESSRDMPSEDLGFPFDIKLGLEIPWRQRNDGQYEVEFGIREADEIHTTSDSCQLCHLIWRLLLKEEDVLKDLYLTIVEFTLILDASSLAPVNLRLEFWGEDGAHLYENLPLMPLKDAEELLHINPPPIHSSAKPLWAQIKNWMAECCTCHIDCKKDKPANWLPTRLIDVGVPFSENEPRLVLSENIRRVKTEPRVNYIALSHVWGEQEFLRLTTKNIRLLQATIPRRGLSRTFRDAISASRELGVRYLWIDSLCILQDSKEDWQAESSAMHLVYKNTLCNIAASGPHIGLFSVRDPFALIPLRIDFNPETTVLEPYYCFYDWWESVRQETPISRRGWVVQERLLSPRTIHFSTPIFWECRNLVACESYPKGLSFDFDRSDKIWSYKHGEEVTTMLAWEACIQVFSECALTKSNDKLVAIAGIAKTFESTLDGTYLAGVWSSNIVRGLLWWVNKDKARVGKNSIRVLPYRAPSWSWASIDGPIRQRCSGFSRVLVQVGEVQVVSTTTDQFGEVERARLDIRGILFVVPNARIIFEEFQKAPTLFELCFSLDTWIDLPECAEEIQFLPLVSCDRQLVDEKTRTFLGLLLHLEDSSSIPWTYRRIGIARINWDGSIASSTKLVACSRGARQVGMGQVDMILSNTISFSKFIPLQSI